jgi:hypothetical protein
VCIRSVKGAVLQELGLDRPHRVPRRPVDLVVRERAYDKYCLSTSAARCSTG